MQKWFHFKLAEYILIAMMAALGIAVKVIITPLAHIITGPLLIPGGVAAGGFYMLFLVLAISITQKGGTAFLVALVQAVLVMITGMLGSHGAASLLTYTLPGLAVEAVWLLAGRGSKGAVCCFAAGICANMAGSYSVNFFIFRLPIVPLLLSLAVAALFGGLGGWVAYGLANQIRRLQIWQA
ncbi:MAG: ECF transporter S component [Clostridiales bacterium]|jgi:hypothetical protein|nr:ECF transporter S component [Clostridiales bacterium]